MTPIQKKILTNFLLQDVAQSIKAKKNKNPATHP
jgi:hypothetical protein